MLVMNKNLSLLSLQNTALFWFHLVALFTCMLSLSFPPLEGRPHPLEAATGPDLSCYLWLRPVLCGPSVLLHLCSTTAGSEQIYSHYPALFPSWTLLHLHPSLYPPLCPSGRKKIPETLLSQLARVGYHSLH